MVSKPMNKLLKPILLIAYVAVAAYSTNASAAPVVIDFGTGLAGSGGVIDYDGFNVTGSKISIGSLEVVGTKYDDVYVADAVLNFDTKANNIEVVGSIAKLGITSSTLLSGSFNNWSYETTAGGVSAIFSGEGIDYKSPELLKTLGIDPKTQFEFFAFSLGYDFDLDGNATAISTDLINTSVIPVPAAVWLFGSGLIGLIGVARRKKA